MKHQFNQSFPAVLAVTVFVLTMSPSANAGTAMSEIPDIWKESPQVQLVTNAISPRIMTADEPWTPGVAGDQVLQTGDASRTITLAPIGADGFHVGTRLFARVTASAGNRILFRKADGELIAFWGAEDDAVTKGVSFEGTAEGWQTRIAHPGFFPPDDPAFYYAGADVATRGRVYARPADGASAGYSIRFETESPVLYISSRGDDIRFRVMADDLVVANVAINRAEDGPAMVPLRLGEPAHRRIEILAQSLEFGGVELPDVRDGIQGPDNASSTVRMLWISEPLADAGTRGFPWVAARLLGYDVFGRAWSSYAPQPLTVGKTHMPAEAIARDVAKISPDVVVISSDCFDEDLDRRDYTRLVGEWFDAVDKALRPESLKIVLPSWKGRGPVDREASRRAKIIAKEAKRLDFLFVDWQDWIEGRPDNPSSGNAHLLVVPDGTVPTEFGHRYIGHRFAQEVRRADVGKAVQAAALARHQETGVKNAIAVGAKR